MGRKSKRNLVNISEYQSKTAHDNIFNPATIKEKIPTAIYARLSVLKPGENDESIDNQISLIHRYILEHPEMELIEIYADIDRTGTNFQRPEFARLISDMARRRVTCVVVKDLSRFGRDYIEAGFYIENILPKYSARLIAINDNFDSSRSEDVNGLAYPLKNMINEMYAKDISRKVKSANKIRNRRSDSKLRGNAPYGYKYEDDKLVVDERYARYVRFIFQWRSMGMSGGEIADRLTFLGAPIPGNVTGNKSIDKFGDVWLASKVYNILNNPEYTGDAYRGRFETYKFGGSSKTSSEDQWLVYPNTHEPLVTREEYWKIAERRKEKKIQMKKSMDKNEEARNKLTSDFPGLIYCADCKKPMIFSRKKIASSNGEYTHGFYACEYKEGYPNACHNEVSVEFLKMILKEQINYHLMVMSDRADILKEIRNSNSCENGLAIDRQIEELNRRLSEAKEKNIKLYEDYVGGLLDIEDYRILKSKVTEDDNSISEKLNELYKEKNHQLRNMDDYISTVDGFIKTSNGEVNKDMINAMIERIYITKDKRIEIVFKYDDEFNDLFDYLECDHS